MILLIEESGYNRLCIGKRHVKTVSQIEILVKQQEPIDMMIC